MKFKAGDRFRVKENGITGQIYTEFDIDGKRWYGVLWDHFSRSCNYPALGAEDIWDLTVSYKEFGPSRGDDFKNINSVNGAFMMDDGSVKLIQSCDHQWTTYNGFSESYEFCKKCDEKRRL